MFQCFDAASLTRPQMQYKIQSRTHENDEILTPSIRTRNVHHYDGRSSQAIGPSLVQKLMCCHTDVFQPPTLTRH